MMKIDVLCASCTPLCFVKAHDEPPHQDLRCLQIQLFSSLVVKGKSRHQQICSTIMLDCRPGNRREIRFQIYFSEKNDA